MYYNIGGKLKGLAIVMFVCGFIASIFMGISLMVMDDSLILLGILLIVLGAFVSWISSLALYGFGEIIQKLTAIEKNTRCFKSLKNDSNAENEDFSDDEDVREQSYGMGEILCSIKKFTNKIGESIGIDSDKSIADELPKVICPVCGTEHDMDYPRCPKCKHKYDAEQ